MSETKEATGLRDKVKQSIITCDEALAFLAKREVEGHFVTQKAKDWITNYKKRNE